MDFRCPSCGVVTHTFSTDRNEKEWVSWMRLSDWQTAERGEYRIICEKCFAQGKGPKVDLDYWAAHLARFGEEKRLAKLKK